MKQLVLDLIPAPIPTFENFVTGRNAEALHPLKCLGRNASTGAAFGAFAADEISEKFSKIVYLWGEAGSGKTHLLRALKGIANTFFLSSTDLQNEIPEAGCYAIDNVQCLTDIEQVGLFNLINRVNQPDGTSRLVACGNIAPRDLPLRPELSSRLGSGLVFQLHPLSDAEKIAALRAHAKTRSFTLREEVITYLLRHARRDMASLIAMLDTLDQHSLETGREITLPLLREVLQPTLPTI